MSNKLQLLLLLLLIVYTSSIKLPSKNQDSQVSPTSSIFNKDKSDTITTSNNQENAADDMKEVKSDAQDQKQAQLQDNKSNADDRKVGTAPTKGTSAKTNVQNKANKNKSNLKQQQKSQEKSQEQLESNQSVKQTHQSNNEDSSNQQQSEAQTNTKSKTKSIKSKTSSKNKHDKNTVEQQQITAKIDYSHGFWQLFLIYLFIFAILIVGVKYLYFPNQNFFLMLIDIMILFSSWFKQRQNGYKAPQYNQEIDDQHSITVGYNGDQGQQLFWQKNSVEGI